MSKFFTQDYIVVPTTTGENRWLGRVPLPVPIWRILEGGVETAAPQTACRHFHADPGRKIEGGPGRHAFVGASSSPGPTGGKRCWVTSSWPSSPSQVSLPSLTRTSNPLPSSGESCGLSVPLSIPASAAARIRARRLKNRLPQRGQSHPTDRRPACRLTPSDCSTLLAYDSPD